MTWRHQAACAGTPTAIFYPRVQKGRGTHHATLAHHTALTICRQCPVTNECLNEALNNNDEHGIWGATTPQDRQALQRIRQRQVTA